MKNLMTKKDLWVIVTILVILLTVVATLIKVENDRANKDQVAAAIQKITNQQQIDAQLLNDVESSQKGDMVQTLSPLDIVGAQVIIQVPLAEDFRHVDGTDNGKEIGRVSGKITIYEKFIQSHHQSHHLIGVTLQADNSFKYEELPMSLQGYLDVRIGDIGQTFEELTVVGNSSTYVQPNPGSPITFWIESSQLPSSYARVEANWNPTFLGDNNNIFATANNSDVDELRGLFVWVSTGAVGDYSYDRGEGPYDPVHKCSRIGGINADGKFWEGGECNY